MDDRIEIRAILSLAMFMIICFKLRAGCVGEEIFLYT